MGSIGLAALYLPVATQDIGSSETEDENPSHTQEQRPYLATMFHRLSTSVRQRLGFYNDSTQSLDGSEPLTGTFSKPVTFWTTKGTWQLYKWWSCKKALYVLPILVLCIFGILHVLQVIVGGSQAIWNVNQVDFLPNWGMPGRLGHGLVMYPTDATRDVTPIPCHSHNDYMRRVPLFDAIHAGCIGVEADVWLLDEELYVGHRKTALTANRTFRALYVDPIVDLLDRMNTNPGFTTNTTDHGVFDKDPNQTLVLLVDIKTGGNTTFPYVYSQLEPLRSRNYLTYWDGNKVHPRAITIVGTGNTPFDRVVENTTYRDIFFDAPLGRLWGDSNSPVMQGEDSPDADKPSNPGKGGAEDVDMDSFNTSTSYYASVSFRHAVGSIWLGRLSYRQRDILRGHIYGANRRGLKARYWDTPSWPISLRDHVWSVLVEEGVDMLNVDDLEGAAQGRWKARYTRALGPSGDRQSAP